MTRSGRNSLSGQRSVCAPLRQVMQAMPLAASQRNSCGLQPSRSNQRQVRLRRRARGGRQQAERLQLRHDAVADLGHHLRIDLLVDAQQGRAAERVEPVAGRGRQLQFLARDEVLGQVGLAAVDLDMAIDEQRGRGGGIVRGPLPGQGRAPGVQHLGVGGQLVQLAPQGARLGAAVQAQQGAPFAGLLVAQALGVAHARQEHEGQQQQHGAQAVEAGRNVQQAGMAQQAGLQQRRDGRQHATVGNGRGGFEAWQPLGQQAEAGRDAPANVPRRPAHRSGRVAPVAAGLVHAAGRAARGRLGGNSRAARAARPAGFQTRASSLGNVCRQVPGRLGAARSRGRFGDHCPPALALRRDPRQQALALVLAQRLEAQLQLPRHATQARAPLQPRARHRARADPERLRQFRRCRHAPRQEARQAARARRAIALQVAVAHLQVQEPIHLAAVLQQAQLRVDSGRLRRLQGQGRGQSGGSR